MRLEGRDERNALERGCLLGLWKAILALFEDQRRKRDEDLAAEVIDDPSAIADFEILLEGEDSKRTLPMGKRPRRLYISGVVASVKNIMGTPDYNKANLLVVRRLCRQKMEDHGLRQTHIAEALPLAVEAVFVEAAHEVAARAWGKRLREGGNQRFGKKLPEPRF